MMIAEDVGGGFFEEEDVQITEGEEEPAEGDVGDAALYYFSDLSKKVSGNIHFVDGGFNIMAVPVIDAE